MKKTVTHQSNLIWYWITSTLTAVATLSAPFLFDGISYIKVCIALVMISIILPIIFFRLSKIFSIRFILTLLMVFLAIVLYLLYLNANSYRSVFGAPGRHNGFLNFVVCTYFLIIGVYAKKFCTILVVYRSISIVSVFSSSCILMFTMFDIGDKSIFASNNLSSSNFAENSNLVAPLLCVGFISSVVSYINTKNYLYLVALIPLAIVMLQLNVIQVYLNLGISLAILWISTLNRSFRAFWFPLTILGGYLLGLLLVLQGAFNRDSSIKERADILREAGKLSDQFSLFPVSIDGLSDLTLSFSGTEFLDDFHNVFLQTLFSLGVILGIAFFLLAILPYFLLSLPYRQKLEFFSVYTSMLISLLIGISSPNYIYIFFILLGYSSATMLKSSQVLALKQHIRTPIFLGLIVVAMITPVFIQLDDLRTRYEISNRASKTVALNLFTESNYKTLIKLLSEIDDAEYRNRMAFNFYSIGECKYGDSVYQMMTRTNPHEARLRGLDISKRACVQK